MGKTRRQPQRRGFCTKTSSLGGGYKAMELDSPVLLPVLYLLSIGVNIAFNIRVLIVSVPCRCMPTLADMTMDDGRGWSAEIMCERAHTKVEAEHSLF